MEIKGIYQTSVYEWLKSMEHEIFYNGRMNEVVESLARHLNASIDDLLTQDDFSRICQLINVTTRLQFTQATIEKNLLGIMGGLYDNGMLPMKFFPFILEHIEHRGIKCNYMVDKLEPKTAYSRLFCLEQDKIMMLFFTDEQANPFYVGSFSLERVFTPDIMERVFRPSTRYGYGYRSSIFNRSGSFMERFSEEIYNMFETYVEIMNGADSNPYLGIMILLTNISRFDRELLVDPKSTWPAFFVEEYNKELARRTTFRMSLKKEREVAFKNTRRSRPGHDTLFESDFYFLKEYVKTFTSWALFDNFMSLLNGNIYDYPANNRETADRGHSRDGVRRMYSRMDRAVEIEDKVAEVIRIWRRNNPDGNYLNEDLQHNIALIRAGKSDVAENEIWCANGSNKQGDKSNKSTLLLSTYEVLSQEDLDATSVVTGHQKSSTGSLIF